MKKKITYKDLLEAKEKLKNMPIETTKNYLLSSPIEAIDWLVHFIKIGDDIEFSKDDKFFSNGSMNFYINAFADPENFRNEIIKELIKQYFKTRKT